MLASNLPDDDPTANSACASVPLEAVVEQRLKAIKRLGDLCSWEWDRTADRINLDDEDRRFLGRAPGWWPSPTEFWALLEPEEFKRVFAVFEESWLEQRLEASLVHRISLPSGPLEVLCRTRFEYDVAGQAIRMLGIWTDVTHVRHVMTLARPRVFRDAATGLANGALFRERLSQAVANARWNTCTLAVAILNLDRFRDINDSLGHVQANELLHMVGQRLKSAVRGCDMVARLGGDEFALILPEVRSIADAESLADKLCNLVKEPCVLPGGELVMTASIGLSLYPVDGANVDELTDHAHAALSQAKRVGGDRFKSYSRELTETARERLALECDLRRALTRRSNELVLHYQPKFDLASGRLVGAEALMRWAHPERGLIPPDRFIGLAEDSGLIVGMGAWALLNACATATAWNARSSVPLKMAVNVSCRQFFSSDILSTVEAALESTGCQPGWLELEITESLMMGNHAEVRAELAALTAMGVAIAIDDFGTGYSALGYLASYAISTLKIDRAFIRDVCTSNQAASLVRTIASLARSLDLTLVAEGVETEEQAQFVRELGCEMVQGWLFGRAVPIAEFEALHLNRLTVQRPAPDLAVAWPT